MSRVPGIDDGFWPLFVRDARALPGSPDPRDLAAVMLAESRMDPTQANASAAACAPFDPPCALGLNQIHASNWGAYGIEDPAAYLASSASAQWTAVVRRFFANVLRAHPGAERSAADLYWINFSPATFVPNADGDAIVQPSAPRDPVLADPDGRVRLSSLARVLKDAQVRNGARWSAILRAIEDAERGRTGDGPAVAAARVGGGVGIPALLFLALGVVLVKKKKG